MDILLVSNIILWIMVILMAVVIFALTRQNGVLYERVAPAGALAINKNIEVGQDAPAMSLQSIDARMVQIAGMENNGKSKKAAKPQREAEDRSHGLSMVRQPVFLHPKLFRMYHPNQAQVAHLLPHH